MTDPDAPRPRRGIVTWTLVLSWAAIHALALVLSGGWGPTEPLWALGQPTRGVMLRLGAATPLLVEAGEPWRLLTYGFLHGFLLHLLLNAWVWTQVGRALEAVAGSARTWIVFVASVVGGGLAHVAWTGGAEGELPMVGASAGVFGAVGALLLWSLRSGHPAAAALRRSLVFFLVLSGLLLLLPGVAHAAHAGGFAAGLLAMAFLGPRRAAGPPGALVRALAAILLLATVGAGGIQALQPGHQVERAEVEAFLAQLRTTEGLARALEEQGAAARPERRSALAGHLGALPRPWLDAATREALGARIDAWRPVAEGRVEDPIAVRAAIDAARERWRPHEERLRAAHALPRRPF